MDILEFLGEDFKVVHEFEGWKIGLLRYSERFDSFKQEERHLLTVQTHLALLSLHCLVKTLHMWVVQKKCKKHRKQLKQIHVH